MTTVAVHPSAELYGSDRMFLASAIAFEGSVLAVLPEPGALAAELEASGIRWTTVSFPILRKVDMSSPVNAARLLLRFVLAVPRLAWWLRRHGGTDVYVSTVIAPVWLVAGRLAGATVRCHVHESESGMSTVMSRVLLAPLRLAHLVIVNSQDAQAWVRRGGGEAVGRRTRVVYNGIDEPVATGVLAAVSTSKRVVVVGRLSERKGQDVAVRALACLRARGYDTRLVLVGDCYPGYEGVVNGLRALVRDLRLERHVDFVGFHSNPAPFVASADVVVVPSRVEPFGLVAVEALMLGRPLVVSDVGGLPEIVQQDETGKLVPPGDPEAMAAAIADYLDDPVRANMIATAGQKDARERFSAEGYRSRLREAIRGSSP